MNIPLGPVNITTAADTQSNAVIWAGSGVCKHLSRDKIGDWQMANPHSPPAWRYERRAAGSEVNRSRRLSLQLQRDFATMKETLICQL